MYIELMNELNKDLMASSLAPAILMIIRNQESYGYQIIQELRNESSGELDVAEGTLYPVLKKMEKKKWISGCWKTAESGRERRYYSITAKGRKELTAQFTQWNAMTKLLNTLWENQLSTSTRKSTVTYPR